MAQTPKSISANILGNTQTTLYTVPASTTAIIKGVYASPIATTDSTSQIFSVAKTSSGATYPVTTYSSNIFTAASGGTNVYGANLLNGPITMAAGEKLDVSTSTTTNIIKYLNSSTLFTNSYGVAQIYDVVHNGTIYMAVGRYSTTIGFCASSTDGITWTELTAANGLPQLTAVAYISAVSTWFAIAGSTLVVSSNNGGTWSAVTAPDSNTPASLAASATLGAVYATSVSGSSMWTSSTGGTWAVVSNFGGSTGAGSNATNSYVYGICFDGNRFITSQSGATQSTAAFSTYTFLGCASSWYYGVGQIVAGAFTPAWGGTTYSANYGRYYQASSNITAANTAISRSSGSGNSNEWSYAGTVPASVNYLSVECAGTNTVLIATLAATGSTTRGRSTDGTTFAAATDVRSYTGAVFGLANGYYYSFQSSSTSQCYASTDPTVSTGTLFSSASTFYAQCGAADPVSGAWVIFGCDASAGTSGTQYLIGGSTATTGGSGLINPSAINTDTVATIGGISDVCWSSGDSKFYCTGRAGYVYSATVANALAGTWTRVHTAFYPTSSITNIAASNNTVYLIPTNGNFPYYCVTTPVNSGFATVAQPQAWMYNIYGSRTTSTARPLGNRYMSSNGTNVTVSDKYGRVVAFDTSRSKTTPASIPPGTRRLDLIGSILFAYGGQDQPSGNNLTGITASTYGVGSPYDFGYYSNLNSGYVGTNTAGSKVGYVNGTYYVLKDTSIVYYSTNATSFTNNATISTATVLGSPTFIPYSYVNVGSGTSSLACSYGASNAYTFKATSTASPLLGAATVTVAAVEIT